MTIPGQTGRQPDKCAKQGILARAIKAFGQLPVLLHPHRPAYVEWDRFTLKHHAVKGPRKQRTVRRDLEHHLITCCKATGDITHHKHRNLPHYLRVPFWKHKAFDLSGIGILYSQTKLSDYSIGSPWPQDFTQRHKALGMQMKSEWLIGHGSREPAQRLREPKLVKAQRMY